MLFECDVKVGNNRDTLIAFPVVYRSHKTELSDRSTAEQHSNTQTTLNSQTCTECEPAVAQGDLHKILAQEFKD